MNTNFNEIEKLANVQDILETKEVKYEDTSFKKLSDDIIRSHIRQSEKEIAILKEIAENAENIAKEAIKTSNEADISSEKSFILSKISILCGVCSIIIALLQLIIPLLKG